MFSFNFFTVDSRHTSAPEAARFTGGNFV